jgi:transcription elongation factor Elf1
MILSFTFSVIYRIIHGGQARVTVILMEKITNNSCPRCGHMQLNVYFSDQTDNRVGAWCEFCNLKAYYFGEELVPINN